MYVEWGNIHFFLVLINSSEELLKAIKFFIKYPYKYNIIINQEENMLNGMQLLSSASSLYNTKCSCEQKSDVFNLVFLSLLEANKSQIITQIKSEVLNEINKQYNSDDASYNTVNYPVSTGTSNVISNNSSSTISSEISIASKKYGVDEKLISSIIEIESNYNPNAVSSAGAKGLMQIMPQNYENLGISDPFDIRQNIQGGTKLIKELLDRFDGSEEMALMGYNAGIGRMAQRGVKSENDLYKMTK